MYGYGASSRMRMLLTLRQIHSVFSVKKARLIVYITLCLI